MEEEEHITAGSATPEDGVTVESKSRKNITVSKDLFNSFMDLKRDGETQAMLLQRMVDSVHRFEDPGFSNCLSASLQISKDGSEIRVSGVVTV